MTWGPEPMPSLDGQGKRVSVIVDTPGWFDRYARLLVDRLSACGFEGVLVRSYEDLLPSDVTFLLSCLRIADDQTLSKSRQNIVVHASDLPRGRGFSPVVWQVLEGLNDIPVAMIEAICDVDAGDVLMRRCLHLAGDELHDEIRSKLGHLIVEMCLDFFHTQPQAVPQAGEATWYRRRRPADSELDPDKTIREQFNLLRVVDNASYPAHFFLNDCKYVLSITKEKMEP